MSWAAAAKKAVGKVVPKRVFSIELHVNHCSNLLLINSQALLIASKFHNDVPDLPANEAKINKS
jgi:hypothetical protein